VSSDPYQVLGVAAQADAETVRAAYRRQVKRHHPDLNGGSPESARRFEAVQEAYAAILARRGPADPSLEDRLAALEHEIRARAATARNPAPTAGAPHQPTPEELGQYATEDSFTAILDDALNGVSERLARWRQTGR
jgi:DnaJ-domain-containing protein 1